MDIKPIETYYNGYRFRSRLEARWAVFFDALGVEYEYEPEGIALRNGRYYLPDFYLPSLETFVEIKPRNAFEIELSEDGARFSKGAEKYGFATEAIVTSQKMYLITFGDPYEAFPRLDNQVTDCKSHLFYFGECGIHYILKEANKNGGNFKCKDRDGNIKDCAKCDHHDQISMHSFPVFIHKDQFIVSSNEYIFNEHVWPFYLIFKPDKREIYYAEKESWRKFHEAGLKARQARFEHGEAPTF